jgi:hypothetical protein
MEFAVAAGMIYRRIRFSRRSRLLGRSLGIYGGGQTVICPIFILPEGQPVIAVTNIIVLADIPLQIEWQPLIITLDIWFKEKNE